MGKIQQRRSFDDYERYKDYRKNRSETAFFYYVNFDLNEEPEEQILFVKELKVAFQERDISVNIENIENDKMNFYSIYGALLFLGIFIGCLFIMATVLIIYYKQISEGYDDKDRFHIMQNVGMSKEEVKKAIRSQVLTVFFLPLITAFVHIAFAFKMIMGILALFGLTKVGLFGVTTVITMLVFALMYGLVYIITSRAYYKIVG